MYVSHSFKSACEICPRCAIPGMDSHTAIVATASTNVREDLTPAFYPVP